jgi:N-acetylglucosaminyldiphosphoundecaprenol N-acetyl-beta-D-mannosaminyltransferase
VFSFHLNPGLIQLTAPHDDKIDDALAPTDTGKTFHFVNAFSLVSASKNASHLNALSNGACFCDSKPLSWYSTLVGNGLGQLRGSDFLILGLERKARERHLVIGGDGLSIEDFRSKVFELTHEFVDILFFIPPYTEDIDVLTELCSKEIANSDPQLVWLAVGTPKQDILAHQLSKRFQINFYCVGAAVNFVSGTVREAPKFLSNLGLEWAFRLVQEPRRLWRRYLIGNVEFVSLLLKDLKVRIEGRMLCQSGK